MVGGCRSSGLLTADGLVYSGKCKLVSIHATNLHGTDASIVIIYDNTAASGKVVAKFVIPGISDAGGNGLSPTLEFDMHSVLCENGLFVDVTNGTPNLTIEFA
jgi:hypothetical protein